jgi:hypothetical protein
MERQYIAVKNTDAVFSLFSAGIRIDCSTTDNKSNGDDYHNAADNDNDEENNNNKQYHFGPVCIQKVLDSNLRRNTSYTDLN